MLFSSIPFLYYFLPIFFLLYFISPTFVKNYILVVFSLLFYAWGEPKYVFLMIASIFVGYLGGILVEKNAERKRGKFYMILSVAICVFLLCWFKYADFFIVNFNRATGFSIPLLHVVLPIGISFYTFQILSYVVDVYRKDVPAQKNPFYFATYVTMFPQLIAGPIVRYADIAVQIENRKTTVDGIAYGIRQFVLGLGKKVLIANTLGAFCDAFFASDDKAVLFYWLYAVAYALQIYFDFSGYSDMAIGIGSVLGFRFLENFNYPFISTSISEFWRRWHMSLGTWFRDYIYIPMGGNRVSMIRWIRNILVVWGLTGFWHGAEWNFVFWGLYFAVFLMMEKFLLSKWLNKHPAIAHIYVLFVILFSFIIFSATQLDMLKDFLLGLFGRNHIPLISSSVVYYLRSYAGVFILAIIGATPLLKNILKKVDSTKIGTTILCVFEPITILAILIMSTAYLVDGSFNPFLYFRF